MCNHFAVKTGNFRDLVAVFVSLMLCFVTFRVIAAEQGTVEGTLIANGKSVELPYVYMWADKEGFYDPADPTWNILFVERPLKPRELGEHIWDAAWVQIGITETEEFAEQPQLEVYLQSIKLSSTSSGNISGGNYPEIALEGVGSDLVSGRIWHTQSQEFFDDTYQYDFTFTTSISDPDAPIGELLPADGGEPGLAYLKWVEVVHIGEIEKLQSIVPSEMAAQLNAVTPDEAREEIEFMQSVTPTEVVIMGGSTDGEIALLQIEGLMDGEKLSAEVTMTRIDNFWIPTGFSM